MYPFEISRPDSVDAAKAAYAKSDNAAYLAGGMTLLPSMKQHLNAPDILIDLSAIPALTDIRWDAGKLTVGALVTHAAVARHAEIRKRFPALAGVAALIADRHVRNRGTIGGSLSNNDPAADYPAAVLATAASIKTSERSLTPEDFFTGMFETALEPGEILEAIQFDLPEVAGYEKFAHPISGYAMAGVFACRVQGATRIAVTGAGADGVFRIEATEQAAQSGGDIEAALSTDLSKVTMLEDHYAEAAYRENLVRVMCRRALAQLG